MKQTATVCSMVVKNPETALKKRNKCNKGILYAVLCFIVKQTATNLSNVGKKSEESKKKGNKCNKGILYMQYGGSL